MFPRDYFGHDYFASDYWYGDGDVTHIAAAARSGIHIYRRVIDIFDLQKIRAEFWSAEDEELLAVLLGDMERDD